MAYGRRVVRMFFGKAERERPKKKTSRRMFSLGAELHNLLRLFEALIDGIISSPLRLPTAVISEELIVY